MSLLIGESHFFEENTTPAKVQQYLDSLKESEKLKGMKWLLAMMSKGKNVSNFFPNVVKNVSVKSVEVKKMVYMYLVHHADADEECRNIVLLSINSFQKDLGASSQFIRGLALRVMTSIRIPDIIQIQIFAIRKCAADSSPYVRKCAANAIPKIHRLDPEQSPQLLEVIDRLLRDNSTMVLGSAIIAFNDICPNNFDMMHRPFRKICHLLADLDEWSQTIAMQVLTRYTRSQFMDPSPGLAAAIKLQSRQIHDVSAKGGNVKTASRQRRRIIKKGFYSDESDKSSEEEEVEVKQSVVGMQAKESEIEHEMDPDHKLVLKSSLPLLKSRNTGVVLAVCGLHYYCGTQTSLIGNQIGRAMVRILRNNREVQYVVLSAINRMVQERPSIFRPFLKEFFVKPTDPVFSRLFKLDVLAALVAKENVDSILMEMQTYLRHGNKEFVMSVVDSVGRIANAQPQVAVRCLDGLMMLCVASIVPEIVGRAMNGIRQILQQIRYQCPDVVILFVRQVAKFILLSSCTDDINTSSSNADREGIAVDGFGRAAMIWMIGEFLEAVVEIAPDITRHLALGFTSEEDCDVRLQIINLAAKIGTRFPDDDAVQELSAYTLELGSFDTDIDIRDRSRFLIALLGMVPCGNTSSEVNENSLEKLREKSRNIILQAKSPPLTLLGPVSLEALQYFDICSLSFVLGHPIQGYIKIPDWPEKRPDPAVRDAPVVVTSASASKPVVTSKIVKNKPESDDDDDDEEEEDDDEEEEDEEEEDNSQDEAGATEQEVEDDKYLVSRQEKFDNHEEEEEEEENEPTDYDFSGNSHASIKPKAAQVSSQPRFRKAAANKTTNFSSAADFSQPLLTTDKISTAGNSSTLDDLLRAPTTSPARSATDDLNEFLTASKPLASKTDSLEELIGMESPAVSSPRNIVSVVDEDAKEEDYSMASLKASTVPISLPQRVTSRPSDSVLSPYALVARQELSWGLVIEYAFVRSGFDFSHASSSSATSIFLSLRVTNKRPDKDNVTRFRIVFPSSKVASSATRTPWIDIDAIPSNVSIERSIELDFRGEAVDEVAVDIRSNRGDCKGSMKVTPLDVCKPLVMANAVEFERIIGGLSGIRESKVSLQLRDEVNNDLGNVLRCLGNFSNIPSNKDNIYYFSALYGASTRIMVQAVLDRTSAVAETHLHVYSDDGMMTSQLLAIMKRQLTK